MNIGKELNADLQTMRDKIYNSLVNEFGTKNLFMKRMRILNKNKEGKYVDSDFAAFDKNKENNEKIFALCYPIEKENIGIYIWDAGRFSSCGKKLDEITDDGNGIEAFIKNEKIDDDLISRITTEDFPDTINLPELTKLMCRELFGNSKYVIMELENYFHENSYIQIDIRKLCEGKYESAFFDLAYGSDFLHLRFNFKSTIIALIGYDYNEKKFTFEVSDKEKIALLCDTVDEIKLFKILNKTKTR